MDYFLWNMKGFDKYDQDVLEQNRSQYDNTLWNMIGINKSDWGGKELNGSKNEGFSM